MVLINFTNITNANSTLQLILALDNIPQINGWFSIFILLGLWIITFVSLSFYDANSSFMMSSFFSSVIAGLMLAAGMIDMFIFVFCVVITVIAFLVTIFMKG